MLKIKDKIKRISSIISLTFLLTTLVACENAPVRREELLTQHPDWNSKTVKLIRDGKIFIGMTKDQVRATWGRHCFTCQGTTEGTEGESWEYATQVVFFDNKGKVVRLSTK